MTIWRGWISQALPRSSKDSSVMSEGQEVAQGAYSEKKLRGTMRLWVGFVRGTNQGGRGGKPKRGEWE